MTPFRPSGTFPRPRGKVARSAGRGLGRYRLLLTALPVVQDLAGVALLRVHRRFVTGHLGGEFDHVAVRVTKIDRTDELVIGDAAHLAAFLLAALEHRLE